MGRNIKVFVILLATMLITSSFALGLSAVKAAAASPRTIIVPDDFLTIQAAIDNASAGDTVYVRAGNYNTTAQYHSFVLVSLLIDKPISLIGENCQDTIITTTQRFSWDYGLEIAAANVAISGFTIKGNVNIILFGASSGIVSNNIIILKSSYDSSIAIEAFGSGIISSNIIDGNGNSGTGILQEGNIAISNNIINGFEVGIATSSSSPLNYNQGIVNNTITNNAIGLQTLTIPTLFYGNNIVNCTQHSVFPGASGNLNATYNWWGTNDTQAIDKTIAHYNSLQAPLPGTVTFIPFLTAPNPQAMPIQNVIKVPNPTSTDSVFPLIITSSAILLVASIVIIFYITKSKGKHGKLLL
jgi:hypothetical protein